MFKRTGTYSRGDIHDQERCMIRRRERFMIKRDIHNHAERCMINRTDA